MTRLFAPPDRSPYQDRAAQEAADRINSPKRPMRDWWKDGCPYSVYTFEEAPAVQRVDWVCLLAWSVIAGSGLVTALCLGWFVRDHAAPWLRHSFALLGNSLRAWFAAWA